MYLLRENLLEQERLEIFLRIRALSACVWVPSTSGKPTDGGVSGIMNQINNGDENGDGRRNKKTEPPVGREKISTDQKAAEQDNQNAADIVGGVPDGELGRELFGRKPVGHQPRAGRKTHALKPAVEHPDEAEAPRRSELNPNQTLRSAEASSAVAMKTQAFARSARKPFANFDTPYITPCSVRNRPRSSLVMPRSLLHERHGDAEVLAHEIKRGVANDGKDQDAHLPATVFRRDFRRIGQRDRHGWCGLKDAQPALA